MESRFVNILKYLLGWPFSILAFVFILKLIIPKSSEFLTNIKSLNVTLLIFGLLSFMLFYFIRSCIWHNLVKLHSQDISYKKSTYFWAISELKRYIPGNVWGFIGRALAFSDMGIGEKEVGKLVLVEGGLFVIGATLFSLLSLPFLGNKISPIFASYQIFIILVVFALASFYVISKKPINFFMNFPVSLKMSFLFLSTLAAFFFGLGYYFVISSFIFLQPQLVFQLTGFFVLSTLIGVLSFLTPAGFGVREGLLIFGLSKIISSSSSALGALFGRVALITSELIFILISYLVFKIQNRRFLSIEKWLSHNKHEAVLGFIFLVYSSYFTITSFARYDNFYTGRFDLGNMAQTIWNTTHGNFFMLTDPNGTATVSRLAFHSDFLLILLAPFYFIWEDPRMLLLLQTLIVGAGCFFVYKIAKNVLKNKNLALAFGLAYLLNPSIQRANLYDFHPVTLATTFLLGAFYFYSKKRYFYFAFFALLAALTKEQIWFVIGIFGLFLFFQRKKYLLGSLVFLGCAAVFYFLVSFAIPQSLGSSHFALSYYSDFGDKPSEVIKTVLFSPQKTIGIVLQKDRLDYLKQLFLPVGFISVLSPTYLIFAAPDLLINLLSNNAQLHQIYYQYTAVISPFLFISTIYGLKRLRQFSMLSPQFLITYLLVTSIISAYLYGPLPGAKDANTDMFTHTTKNREYITDYVSQIPKGLSVAASNNLGSHLSHRENIYILPIGIDKADIVTFLLNNSEQPESLKTEKNQLQKLRADTNYELLVEKGEFVVFKKKNI